MQLYLVVYAPASGIAELLNVGIVEAASAREAREKACALFNAHPPAALHCMRAFPVADLPDGWSYFA